MDLIQQMQAAILGGRGLAHTMALGTGVGDVHIDQALSTLAVKFYNEEYIADLVCPVLGVGKRSDKFFKFNRETMFNVAKVDIASQRGRPGEINYGQSTDNFSVKDYGLMDFIPADLEANADAPLAPGASAVENLMNFLMLAREKRVLDLLSTSGNYGSNTVGLSGTDRFDSTGDPLKKIDEILATPLVRPNVAVFGEKAWREFRNNQKVKDVIQYRASSSEGASPLRVSRSMVASALELDAIYVPMARYNTAADGLTATLSRLFPTDSVAFIRVERRPDLLRTHTFAYTFRFGGAPAVETWFDRVVGVRGGTWYKATHSDDEKLVAGSDAGYLLTTVVS